jgi:hypothetical protein
VFEVLVKAAVQLVKLAEQLGVRRFRLASPELRRFPFLPGKPEEFEVGLRIQVSKEGERNRELHANTRTDFEPAGGVGLTHFVDGAGKKSGFRTLGVGLFLRR